MSTLAKLLKKPFVSSIIAILCGFIVAIIILACSGYNPFTTLATLFSGMVSRPKYVSNVLIKSAPFIIIGVGISFAYKTGLFNIGAEGQYIVGALAAMMVGSTLDIPGYLLIPLIILAAVIASGIWGGIVGVFKAKFGINEVITSIMLNWIALYLSNYVIKLPAFADKGGHDASNKILPQGYTTILRDWKLSDEGMETLKKTPWLYDFLLKTDVNIGILVAIALAIFISFLLFKTVKGYEVRAVGLNRHAAELAGINVSSNIVQTMVISGAICGLAAALVLMGQAPHRIPLLATFENNGFNGLSVALIANSSPIGCIFSGLLFGGLLYGGRSLQSQLGVPTEIINITIGVIVFFMALTIIVPKIAEKLEKRGTN